MSARYLLFGVCALVLAGLNIWQWSSPGTGRAQPGAATGTDFRAENFQLKMNPTPAESGARGRDLFHIRLPAPPAIKKVETPSPAPPAKTPEQLAAEAARAELAQIKLVGVVFRGDEGEAFLVMRDQLHTVRAGGKIGERFQVETIREDSIQVKDPATQVSGSISISGK